MVRATSLPTALVGRLLPIAALAATCCLQATASTVLPARIDTNTTWTAEASPYEMQQDLYIAAGAEVTVQPGVSVRAMGDYRMTIAGRLTARGSQASRISFRAPDAHAVGAWKGLYFTTGSRGFFQLCTLRSGQDLIMADSANVQLYNCQVRLASRDGLYAWGDSYIRASYCTFQNNGRYGLHVQTSTPRGSVLYSNFVGNGDYPCMIKATCAEMLKAGNTFSSNGQQMIGVDCGSAPDIEDVDRWRDQLVPYDCNAGGENQELEIAAGGSLKLDPGVRVYPPRRIVVDGRLVVTGLGQQRVVIAPPGAPQPGDWLGIDFNRNSFGWLNVVTVGWAREGLTMNDAEVFLRNTLIRDCELDGVFMGGTSSLDAMDSTFSDCGRSGVRAPQPSSEAKLVNCTITSSGDYPVYGAATWVEALRTGNAYTGNARQAIGVACNQDTDITDDDAWLPQGVPYDLTASDEGTYLRIGGQGRLSLRPGVQVIGGGIGAAGILVAGGESGERVTLGSAAAVPAPGDWLGVEFLPGGTGRIVHTVLTHAQTGVAIASDRDIRVTNTTIRDCAVDGIRTSGPSAPIIRYCTINRNGEMGVRARGNSRPRLGNQSEQGNPGQNSLFNNGQYDLANETAGRLWAENNWWNAATGAEVRQRIYDAEDNASVGQVDFQPFLSVQPTGLVTVARSDEGEPALAIMSVAAVATDAGAAIHVTVSRPAAVRVTVRNIAGRLVRSLEADVDGAGVIPWDRRSEAGSLAPSGRYLIEVEAHATDGTTARSLGSLTL